MEKYLYDYNTNTQFLFEHPLDVIKVIKAETKHIKNYQQIADYIDCIYIHGLTVLEVIYISKQVAMFLAEKQVPEARMQYLLEEKYKALAESSEKKLTCRALSD